MDRLGSLNAFVQAAEARSFVKAGQQLGVSSSAIGKAVARLEDRMGVRLFHRSTRSITLTTEGTLFLERCRRIFCEIEAAELELSQSRQAPQGRLRVSLPLAAVLLTPPLAAFMRAYPEIELDLDFTDRLVDVIEDGFDAAIRTGPIQDSRLMNRVLGTFRHVLVASPAYLAAHGTPATPAELSHHACLRHRYPTTGKLARWPLHIAEGEAEPTLPTVIVSTAADPLIALTEQGFGLSCLPDFLVQEPLRQGRLVPVLEDFMRDTRTLRILWPSSRHLAPKLRVFVDFMAKHLLAPA